MILLRTHVFGAGSRGLFAGLGGARGGGAGAPADETRQALDVGPFRKVSVTRAACRTIGLHCPRDFTWRNGDYALYLARRQFPDERFFWLVEPDVEHSFASDAALFERFDSHPDIDLLAPYVSRPITGWWWAQTARPHPTGARRALFCFLRVSARAVDLCLRQRRRGLFSVRDLLYWPNDEAFVATELAHAGFPIADLNDVGPPVYDDATFGYDEPLSGDDGGFRSTPDRIFHPVLYGADYAARIERIRAAERSVPRSERARRKLQRKL